MDTGLVDTGTETATVERDGRGEWIMGGPFAHSKEWMFESPMGGEVRREWVPVAMKRFGVTLRLRRR